MTRGQQPQKSPLGQTLDLQQLAQARQMQQQQKGNAVMNIALQMFLQGKAASFDDAFILAEQFLYSFELRYGDKSNVAATQKDEAANKNTGGNHPRR